MEASSFRLIVIKFYSFKTLAMQSRHTYEGHFTLSIRSELIALKSDIDLEGPVSWAPATTFCQFHCHQLFYY